MLVVMCQALPISVVSIIPHPIISTNTNNFPKLEILLFAPVFHIALFYWFVHLDLEDLLQKQIFKKMLHMPHSKKSLLADRRDWKFFNYSLQHFIGVKSARIRARSKSRLAELQVPTGRWSPPPPPSPRATHHRHQLLGYSPHLFCLSKLNVVSSTRAGGVIIYLPSRKLPRSAHINTSAAATLWTTQHSDSIISVCVYLLQ